MNQQLMQAMCRWIVQSALTVGLLLGANSAGAQDKSGATKVNEAKTAERSPSTSEERSAATEKSPGGPQEGIKIHGHWTIVVRDSDGKVASRNEFENALVPNGTNLLAAVLGKKLVMGQYTVNLAFLNGGTQLVSTLAEIDGSLKLIATTNTTVGTMTLSGTLKAPQAGNITIVESAAALCFPTVTPAVCSATTQGNGVFGFTSHSLSPSIPVQNGQTVDVTVTFSFS